MVLVPVPVAAISASRGDGAARLLTPSPKEAFLDSATGSAVTVTIDLGFAQNVDTVFVGSCNAGDAATMSVTSGTSGPTGTAWDAATLPMPYKIGRLPRHGLCLRASPTTARYLNVTLTQPGDAPPLIIGNIAAGLRFVPTWGREYGSGRGVIDTGSRERLLDGGFGTNKGTRKAVFNWTMGDLTDTEVDQLYDLALRAGETDALMMCEDPDATPGMAERTHWGVFDKLEPFERFAPGATRWAFGIEEWR